MHILLCLFRKFGSSMMPTQLYNDLMETFRYVFICAAKYKSFKPEEPLYVVTLGTDDLENSFNHLRGTHNSGSMDCLEIINPSQWIHAVNDVLVEHPDWKTKHYGSKRLTLDHSNVAQWDTDTLKMKDVDINALWQLGLHKASILLLKSGLFSHDEINFSKIVFTYYNCFPGMSKKN